MSTKKDIRFVVERLFNMAAGGSVKTNEVTASKFPAVVKRIEETYDVQILDPSLTVDQIVDICYNTNRARAIQKIKQYVNEYTIDVSEIFPPDIDASIH